MIKFGDYASNANVPIGEKYFGTAPNATLAVQENFLSIGSFQMPFAGTLVVSLWAELDWPSSPQPQVWLSVGNATPALATTGDLGVSQDNAGIFNAQQVPHTFAAWTGLASGQTVSASARIYTTHTGIVKVKNLAGFWRPFAI